jgi:hypothetical protein
VAIVGSVFALAGRFAGRVLNSALSWATILLFGTVDGRKQTVLSLIALGSLVWFALVLGVILPDIGAFLIAAVPVPGFVDETVVRLVMLAAAIGLPLVIGAAAIYLLKPEDRPRGADVATAILRGYPFTLALALTIAFLALISLGRKVQGLARRWESAHVPVVVKPGRYEAVLGDLQRVLRSAGLPVVVRPASRVLSIPPKVLEAAAGSGMGGLVPDRLMLLVEPNLEVLVYPSDIAISGSRDVVARARAAIASELTHAPAYLTTSTDAQRIEDDIRTVGQAGSVDVGSVPAAMEAIDARLARLTVPFDEWETVYRERLQVERDLLINGGRTVIPGQAVVPPRELRPSALEWLAASIGVGLLVVDVLLLVAERLAPPRRRASRH